jgi:hypothetical protein
MGMAMPLAAGQAALEVTDIQSAMRIMANLPDNLPDALATLEYCKILVIEFYNSRDE